MHRLVIALVTVLGLAAASFLAAYLFLFSAATDRAAALAPADAAFYANIYLRPSTGQQMNLSGLIGRLPGFADEASLDEKVDQIVQNLLGETGVDYRSDVKPWLGDQVAIAAWPAGDDPAQTQAVVIAEVRDRAAAEASVASLVSQDGASFRAEAYAGFDLQVADDSAYAFVGEMLLIGSGAEGLHAVIDVEGGAASLANQSAFRAAMSELPADHLASAFVNLASIADAAGVADQFGSFTTASAALVAEADGLRLSGTAPFDLDAAASSARDRFALGTEPSSLVDWMPEDTLAEAVVFGLRQTLEDAEAAISSVPEGEEAASLLDSIRAIAAFGLGIDLDADVLPLLNREVGVAISGLEGALPSGQILLRPDDADAARDALTRIGDRLGGVGATVSRDDVNGTEVTTIALPDIGELAYAVVDGIVIIGFGADDVQASIDAHASGSSLRASEAYGRTFDVAGTRAGTEAFVDIGAAFDLLGTEVALPDDGRDILSQIGTFGLTAPSREDQIEFHAVLTVDKP